MSVPIRAAACAICSRGRDGKAGRSTPRPPPSGSVQASTIPPNDAGLCRRRRRPSKSKHQLCPRDIRPMTTRRQSCRADCGTPCLPEGMRRSWRAPWLGKVGADICQPLAALPTCAANVAARRLGGLTWVFVATRESVTSHEAFDREMPYSPVGQSRFARGYGVPSLRWNSLTPSGPAFSSRSISG